MRETGVAEVAGVKDGWAIRTVVAAELDRAGTDGLILLADDAITTFYDVHGTTADVLTVSMRFLEDEDDE